MSEGVPLQIGLLGLGNLMRTDDAVGMLTLRQLTENHRLPKGVRVIEGETLGLDLLYRVGGISHLLVLDAVDTGVAAGTLVRFAGKDLDDLPISKSVHLLGFSDLMNVLRLMDAAPVEVVLLGVQPESTDWGTVLKPVVEAAKSQLADAALKQIKHWLPEVSGLVAAPLSGGFHTEVLRSTPARSLGPERTTSAVPKHGHSRPPDTGC